MISLRNIFSIKDSLTENEVNKGLRMYVWDGICSTGMATLQGGVYLTAFAIVLGASQKQIGFIASIAFLSQLMQLPGLFLVSKYPKRKFITVITATISRFFWIPIILMPIFRDTGVNFLLIFLFIAAMIGAIPGPAWNSLLRDLLPTDKMGSINSRKIVLSTAIALILTLSGGYFIDWWKVSYPNKEIFSYSILFGLGLVFGVFGVSSIMRIPEPLSTASKVPLRKLLTSPIKDNNFRMLIIFLAVWTFAVNMSGPFFLVYMLNRIKISLFLVTILVVVSQSSNILFLKLWGKIADKFSNKSVLSVSGPLFLVIILLWTFVATPETHKFTIPLLFIIHFLNGIAVSGVSIGTANIALKLSPKGQAHGYMTVVGLSSSVMGAIAPIMGGFFADYFIRMQLDLPLLFSFDADKYSLPILSFRGLEFLFLLTFLIGIYAIHRLALVKEYGEVEKRKVIDELTESIVLPLKSISVVEGIQRMAIMPISGMMHLAGKVTKKKKKNLLLSVF
ncbi:MFS transporter [Bacteroidota bacterium]